MSDSRGVKAASVTMEVQAADVSKQAKEHRNFLQRAWDSYETGLGRFVGWTANHFGRFGAFTARRPVLVLLTAVVASFAVCVGWARFRLESDNDILWVPQKGKARDDQSYVKSYYPRAKAGASFYAQLLPSRYSEFPDKSAIQRAVTWEMFQLHNKIMAVSVSNKDGKSVTFNDLCLRTTSGVCDTQGGYLWFWDKDFNQYISSIGGSLTNANAGNETAFRQRVQNSTYPDGSAVSLLSVFGGTSFSFNPIAVKTATVIASDYTLDDTVDSATAAKWHIEIIDLLQAELPKQQYMSYTFITGSSVGIELTKAINNDIILVIISLLIFMVIAIVFLTKFSSVSTRTSLALTGVFLTALGIVSGWGWGMIFGMPFTPLQQLSPFIMLGVGVDVMLILVKGYEIIVQREPWLNLEEAISKLMSTAGLSVLVAMMTSAVAFALGASDELPSVKWFSAHAALNAVMILVLMMSAFIAVLALTEKRIAANRVDCYCCIVSSNPAPASRTAALQPAGVTHSMAPSPATAMSRTLPTGTHVSDDGSKKQNIVKRIMNNYARLLSKWYVKVPVILFFIAWAVISWYGIYQIKYGQPLSDLAPDGSYLQDYDKVSTDTYKQQVGDVAGLYFRNIDISDPRSQYKMLKAWDIALQNEYVNATTTAFLGNWLVGLISYAQRQNATVVYPGANCYNPLEGKVTGDLGGVKTPARNDITGCIPQDRFWTLYKQWGGSGNVILDAAANPPKAITSRFSITLKADAGDDKYAARMIKSIRSVEKDINNQVFADDNAAADSKSSFIYGGSFVFAEGEAILPHTSLIFFMSAIAGVGVVCTFMLVNPGASLLMMVGVGLVILYLFGELYALDMKFNQVSVINMIMATGLAVDYSVYFAQKFMTVHGDGTGNDRMKIALIDTGSAVFLGAFTALCGTVPMAFAKSVIIRTFFFLMFGTVLFALMVGLILMPVIFSIVNLPPVKSVLTGDVDTGSDTDSDYSKQTTKVRDTAGAEKA